MKNLNPISSFYKLFKHKSTLPRWIIFILDLYICNVALLFAFWLRFNMDFDAAKEYGLLIPILVITTLNVIFFRAYRTYAGIIRLSSVEEGFRCVTAVFCGFFALLASIAVSAIFKLPYLVPTSILIIYFFTASFLIFAYRLLAKELYFRSLKGKFIAENVLIFGPTINSAFFKKAIESITDHNYKVVGFIEESKNLWGKSIGHTNFFSLGQAKSVAAKLRVKQLFMTAEDPDLEMKNKVVDFCLASDIIIKVIPAMSEWIHGKLQKIQLKNLKIEELLSRPDIKLASEHLLEYMTGKTVLITGAAGSIGMEIVNQLTKMPVKQLILCDNRETALHELQCHLQQIAGRKDNMVFSIGDVRSKKVMQNLFMTYRPQIVFHAAAYKHVPLMEMHPCEAIKNNLAGTKIVADLSVHFGVERFVFISTDKAINPTNVMGASKRIAEMYVGKLQASQHQIHKTNSENGDVVNQQKAIFIQEETKFIITRFGNVLGSNGSVIPRFQKQIDEGGPVTVTHPEIIRYFMTIPEACSLVLEACTIGKGGEIFVFDMGEPVKILDLAKRMIHLSGLIPEKDIQIQFTGLRPGEKLYEELLNKNEEVLPTHHEKIMIAKANKTGLSGIIRHVDELIMLAEHNNNLPVVSKMKLIVTEYKSKNSAYEKLDMIENSEIVSLSEIQE